MRVVRFASISGGGARSHPVWREALDSGGDLVLVAGRASTRAFCGEARKGQGRRLQPPTPSTA